MSVRVSVALLFSAWIGVISCIAAEAVDPSKVSPSIAQVVKMHESGVAPDVLLAYVKETPISKPGAEEVLYLTEKGIPKDVIVTLLSKRVWADSVAPQSQPAPTQTPAQTQLPPAVAPTQPASQSVVYVQQPTPAVTYVSPAPYYYSPWYYDPWPRFSIGIGLGHGWHGGHHWHGHGHGGIHSHRR